MLLALRDSKQSFPNRIAEFLGSLQSIQKMTAALNKFEGIFPTLAEDLKKCVEQDELPSQVWQWFEKVLTWTFACYLGSLSSLACLLF